MPRFPTRKQFEKWLRQQPDATVFISLSDTHCPLAVFLKEIYGTTVCVGSSEIHVGNIYKPLPSWAEMFIYNFDKAPGTIKYVGETYKLLTL